MSLELWQRTRTYHNVTESVGVAVDVSRMGFSPSFFDEMEPAMQRAFAAMAELERGAVANPDENRMVGHYWLRNASLAPTPEIRKDVEETLASLKAFARDVHEG